MYSKYKEGLIACLLYRALKICSDLETFGREVDWLRELFVRNRFPVGVFNKVWRDFKKKNLPNQGESDQKGTPPPPEPEVNPDCEPTQSTQPKPIDRIRTLVLPYFGEASISLRKGLLKTLKQLTPELECRIVFSTPAGIGSLFKFKDKIPEDLRTNLVYEYQCPACQAGYVGSTTRHFRSRVLEHLSISERNGNKVDKKDDRMTAVRAHMVKEGHEPTVDAFKVLYSSKERRQIRVAEAILIQRKKPDLNQAQGPFTLRVHPSGLKLEFPRKGRTQKLSQDVPTKDANSQRNDQVIQEPKVATQHGYTLRARTVDNGR
jgi:hypothetical protein